MHLHGLARRRRSAAGPTTTTVAAVDDHHGQRRHDHHHDRRHDDHDHGGSGTLYDVTFDMADAGSAVGALQFEVQYATAGGQFVGAADRSTATPRLSASGGFVTFNDEDGTTTLNFAAVALAGFSGPTDRGTLHVRCAGGTERE